MRPGVDVLNRAQAHDPGMHRRIEGGVVLQGPGQAHEVGKPFFAARAPHVLEQLRMVRRKPVEGRHVVQLRRQRAPALADVAPAVTQLVRGDGFHDRRAQGRLHAVQHGLRLRVAAHRQHQLAAARDEGHAQGRFTGRSLRLHDDVQRQALSARKTQHGRGGFEPGAFGRSQIDSVGCRVGHCAGHEQSDPLPVAHAAVLRRTTHTPVARA